jgi:RNA polymerase sigma-70 factor (ECF subfamily)
MDRVVAEAFKAGKREALDRVYREHLRGIESLVRVGLWRAGCYNAANLADVVQEVFAKAFSPRVRAGYDPARDLGPYLRQLARNGLIDWLRNSRNDVAGDVDLDSLHGDAGPLSEPDAGPFPAEMVDTTRRFVSGLSPELRSVHEQRFWLAESQERAAATLGISRQTLRTRERRLLGGLRRELRATASRLGLCLRAGASPP